MVNSTFVGHIEACLVALDDATAEFLIDQVFDAAEESVARLAVEVPVAGVGVEDPDVFRGVVGLIPAVPPPDSWAEQTGGLDLLGPVRHFVLPGRSPVVAVEDLRRLSCIDSLRGLEEALAGVAVDVLVPEQRDGPSEFEGPGDLRVGDRRIEPVKRRGRNDEI